MWYSYHHYGSLCMIKESLFILWILKRSILLWGESTDFHLSYLAHFSYPIIFCASKWWLLLFFSFEIGSYTVQAGLKFILQPRMTLNFWSPSTIPPKCWGYRYAWPYSIYVLLGIQMRALCMLSKYSTNWATFSAQFLPFNVLFLYIDKQMLCMLDPLLSEAGVPCCFLSVCRLPEVIYLCSGKCYGFIAVDLKIGSQKTSRSCTLSSRIK